MYTERLARLGIEMKTWSEFNDHEVRVPAAYADRLEDAIRDGVAQPDLSPLDWADVILFRRWYSVVPCCESCDTTGSDAAIAAHCRATGHSPNVPDRLLPLLLTTFEKHPEVLRGRAVMYETDDDLIAGAPWLPYYRRLVPDRPIIEAMMRQADLITVTTPVLARMAARYNDSVRVVRNAVDATWYVEPGVDAEEPTSQSGTRVLYYGAPSRLRDYGVCRDAVDDVAARTPGTRRLWLGAAADAGVRAVVDEAFPYVEGVEAFARALAATRPDIGLAPVVGDAFDRAHSELHWLEYSMVGAATIASRTMGGGPYDVIRDGVDGLLARNKAEWRDGLRRLVSSPGLRADLAGKARERVLTEYSADRRAEEWADAYRWAAEHGGRAAVRGRLAGAPSGDLVHRQRARRASAAASALLAGSRGSADVCWPKGAGGAPLVSVVLTAGAGDGRSAARALSSVLAQTYQNFELIVVVDPAEAGVAEAARSLNDPRVVCEGLPPGGDESETTPEALDSRAFNRALELVRGTWIAPLAADDEFTPDHLAILLSAAIDNRLEFVYGQTWAEAPDRTWSRVGQWPPSPDSIGACSMIYSAALSPLKRDEESWREGETSDWNLWRRMWQGGVRMGYVSRPVVRHNLVEREASKVAGLA
jgi:hypothetical protein